MTVPTVTRRLASFVAGIQRSDVPDGVVESAALRTLDILGVAIAARHERGPTHVRGMVRDLGGRPDAHVIGGASATRVPAAHAALANGTAAHALDFDDTHHGTRVHPSAVVVPAVLAAGEAAEATGTDVLLGVVAGIEVAVRMGRIAPGRVHERGLHATSLVGGIAAAAGIGRVVRADADVTMAAMGIAGSTASGLREAYLGTATDTKAFHAGWAAQAGVVAVDLARRGFTGPETMVEGRFGFVRAFIEPEPHDLERAMADLGGTWHTPETVFKLYPCGSLIHASIEAAKAVRQSASFDPEDVEAVECIVPPGMVSTVVEPFARRLNPVSGYDAKFSLPYAVAVALVHGTVGERHYRDEAIADPRVRFLLARTRYRTDPTMRFPEAYPGGVRVLLRDGARHAATVDHSPGSLERPASAEALVEKFRANVEGYLGARSAADVIDRVMNLEHQVDPHRLFELVAGAA